MAEKSKFGEFCWYELATANVQAAKDFYGNVFGWKFTEHDMGDMTYTVFKRDNQEFGGIWAIPKDKQNQIPPHWMAYILVENLNTSLDKARKNGAKVIKEMTQAGDMGLFAIIQDPTGAHIALWEVLKK